jgi:hypothetical protein
MNRIARSVATIAVTAAAALFSLTGSAQAADSGVHYCGEFANYDNCYSQRADFVRHGYRVGSIEGPYGKLGYYFSYW